MSDQPIVAADQLGMRFGPGCDRCRAGLTGDQNRCQHCGSVHALRGLSFAVHSGETLGIVGESGSGKTTLLRLLSDQLKPTSGRLTVPVAGGPVMVHQNSLAAGLHINLAAESNVAERLLRVGERDFTTMRSRSRAMLAELAIPESRHCDILADFSGGMQQRVQLARALVDPPELLLLDEPTTGLDASVQAELLLVIATLMRRMNSAAIVVTHDLDVVRILADRVLVMRHGRVVEQGLPDQLLRDPAHPYTAELVASRLSGVGR